MLIETYECETVPSVEFTDEAIALVEKLGAEKQSNFYREGASVAPYRMMTPEEKAVYEIVLPNRDEIDKFDAGPIPLRVLQVAAHAKEVLEVGTLVVWHQGVGKDDPLMTLRIGASYSGKYYLLARWGEVLEEFSVLRDKAVERLSLKVKSKLAELTSQLESWNKSSDLIVRQHIVEGKTDVPNAYWH